MTKETEDMSIDEYLESRREIRIRCTLEPHEDESKVRLAVAPSAEDTCCSKSIAISKNAIEQVRTLTEAGAAPGSVVEVIIKADATFTASEVFGEKGYATCSCGERTPVSQRLANSGMTTRQRCIDCGCVADWLNCRCPTPGRAECASRSSFWPYVLAYSD